MSTWCPKITQFLFTLPLWGHIMLCPSMLNGRWRVTTGAKRNIIKISPNNLRTNICQCSGSLCSWHHLKSSLWTHLGITETESNQGRTSWRSNGKSDREWVYLLLCFFKPSWCYLGITPGWTCVYGYCKLYLLEEISYISYRTQSVNESSLGTHAIRDFNPSHLKM